MSKTETILVVDDQQKNFQVVGSTLSSFGYDLMVANSGEQAIERVQARMPDLILLDVVMPGMDGFEVCAELKKVPEAAGVPIIFLSAADDKNVIVKALEAGGVDYVTKPFNQAELLARVRTHLELKRTRDLLDELIHQREEFIGTMAHDLKNPLGGARFSAQLLQEKKDELSDTVSRITDNISQAINQSLEMVNQFLNDIRETKDDQQLSLKSLDLASLVNDTVERFRQNAANKSITLNWQKPDTEVFVEADLHATARVLDNILSNSVKFSPRGSRVIVTVIPEDRSVLFEDSGPGFSDEDREGLFKEFTRLSARPTGGETSTGLGLSIAHRLAEKMGGAIEVERSNETGGAAVKVTFAEATS